MKIREILEVTELKDEDGFATSPCLGNKLRALTIIQINTQRFGSQVSYYVHNL